MACGKCGGANKGGGEAMVLRPSQLGMVNGVYETTADPDGTAGRYTGPNAHRTVYIVGRGTPDEQVFTRGRRAHAIAAARQRNLTFDGLPASDLSHNLVAAAFGE